MKNKTAKFIIVALFVIAFQNAYSQLTDLVRLEYSYIPKSNSEDSFKRFRGLINYPIKTSKDCYLVVGGEYSRIALNIEDNYPFNTSNLNRLHVIDLNVAYTFKHKNGWRFGAKISPRIASTLKQKITGDDFLLNGGVYAIKDKTKDETIKKPYRLILGLTYNSTTGIPLPLPFVSYYRRVNERWSYNLGVPKTNVKYFFNEHSILQIFIGIDGYFANIQDGIVIDSNQAESISLSLVVAGLGYEYCITDHLIWYAYSGYTLNMNNRLRDENRKEVYRLDNINAFYLRTGIKFKI